MAAPNAVIKTPPAAKSFMAFILGLYSRSIASASRSIAVLKSSAEKTIAMAIVMSIHSLLLI